MAEGSRARSGERDAAEPPLTAREAVELARQYLAEIIEREPVQMTSVAPSDEGGWIIEVEVVEDRRIPSSSDILALYEVQLDGDGELLAYRRTRRYLRSQTADGRNGGGLE